jgi:hypothetical protein
VRLGQEVQALPWALWVKFGHLCLLHASTDLVRD